MASRDIGSNGFVAERQNGPLGGNRRQVKRWMKKRYARMSGLVNPEELVNAAVYEGGFCGSRSYLMGIAYEVIKII